MKISTRLFALLVATQVFASHGQAQTKAQREDEADGRKLQMEYRLVSLPAQLFSRKLAAHTAEVVTETTKALADGNQIKSKQSYSRYRDQKGRVKIAYQTADAKERIFIADPVAKLAYLIRPNRKDILRLSGPVPAFPAPSADVAAALSKPPEWSKMVTTSLGMKEIDGVKAVGTLSETIYPAGARGNEKEMVESREYWRSAELGEVVYTRSHSPRDGERVTRVENLKLEDVPDAAFALPSDYAIRDIAVTPAQVAQTAE